MALRAFLMVNVFQGLMLRAKLSYLHHFLEVLGDSRTMVLRKDRNKVALFKGHPHDKITNRRNFVESEKYLMSIRVSFCSLDLEF